MVENVIHCTLDVAGNDLLCFPHLLPSPVHELPQTRPDQFSRRRRQSRRFPRWHTARNIRDQLSLRGDFDQTVFEKFFLRDMKGQIFPATGTGHIKCLPGHFFRRDHNVFGGHSLRGMRRDHPAVFETAAVFRQPNRLQFSPVMVQQDKLIRVARRDRQTAVIDLIIGRFQVHRQANDIPFGNR